MGIKNYTVLDEFSLLYRHYCFLDVKEYFADGIFIKNKIKVKFGKEFSKNNYVVIFCKVRKHDADAFEKSMEELHRKMLLLGYKDYEDISQDVFQGK